MLGLDDACNLVLNKHCCLLQSIVPSVQELVAKC